MTWLLGDMEVKIRLPWLTLTSYFPENCFKTVLFNLYFECNAKLTRIKKKQQWLLIRRGRLREMSSKMKLSTTLKLNFFLVCSTPLLIYGVFREYFLVSTFKFKMSSFSSFDCCFVAFILTRHNVLCLKLLPAKNANNRNRRFVKATKSRLCSIFLRHLLLLPDVTRYLAQTMQ